MYFIFSEYVTNLNQYELRHNYNFCLLRFKFLIKKKIDEISIVYCYLKVLKLLIFI